MAEETAESRPYHEDPSGQDRAPEQADMDILAAALESILFAMGDSVPIAEISRALCVPEERARETADLLAERYRKKDSGLILNWLEDEVQLSTKPEMNEYLIRIASEPKKPRMEVENIRGVNSDFAISRLVSFDLVQEVGRKEVPGRPLLFGTTQQFLRSFGISSLEELPQLDVSRMEVFKEEAEEEITSRLNI